MTVEEQIESYIAGQPAPKAADLQALHRAILNIMPTCRLWFLDGTNGEGKIVSNPNIGYGLQTMKYADRTTRDFYRIGLSANKSGISVYILGIADKAYLAKTYGEKLGKASITGYCIKFKALKDIDPDVLQEAIKYGAEQERIKSRGGGTR